jgi:hypothetical protein
MALVLNPVFGEKTFRMNSKELSATLGMVPEALTDARFHYFGFVRPESALVRKYGLVEENFTVDGFFLLHGVYSAGTLPAVITAGVDESRFATIVYWEVYHALAEGGWWVDVTREEDGCKSSLPPVLQRGYYRPSLLCKREARVGALVLRAYRKESPVEPQKNGISPGWSFGILTAGPSPVALTMICDLLRLCPEPVEVIICGPLPEGVPDDSRIRQIDLERPEPRGWITRKKNLLADAARYDKICLMHDRFVVTDCFFSAMVRYGENFPIVTFPQVYYPDASRSFMLRYPDYQVLLDPERDWNSSGAKLFDGDLIFHPKYNDYYPTAFCCGGVYIARKSLWRLVQQDESLFHCEWEDVVFGLDCQKFGIPHRVNPYTLLESLTPHPMLLLGMHVLTPLGEKLRGMPHLSDSHFVMAQWHPEGFRPVLGTSAEQYRAKVLGRLVGTPLEACCLPPAPVSPARIWSILYLAAQGEQFDNRWQVFHLYQLLAEIIFNFPNCLLQIWCRDTEQELLAVRRGGIIARFGSLMFKSGIRVALYLKSVQLLRILRRLARGKVVTFYPLLEQIEQYLLQEKAYPCIFSVPEGWNAGERMPDGDLETLRRSFRDSAIGQATIFCEHNGELVPPLLP